MHVVEVDNKLFTTNQVIDKDLRKGVWSADRS